MPQLYNTRLCILASDQPRYIICSNLFKIQLVFCVCACVFVFMCFCICVSFLMSRTNNRLYSISNFSFNGLYDNAENIINEIRTPECELSILRYGKVRLALLISCSLALYPNVSRDFQHQSSPVSPIHFPISAAPVSYTHLDVYKRQDQ